MVQLQSYLEFEQACRDLVLQVGPPLHLHEDVQGGRWYLRVWPGRFDVLWDEVYQVPMLVWPANEGVEGELMLMHPVMNVPVWTMHGCRMRELLERLGEHEMQGGRLLWLWLNVLDTKVQIELPRVLFGSNQEIRDEVEKAAECEAS